MARPLLRSSILRGLLAALCLAVAAAAPLVSARSPEKASGSPAAAASGKWVCPPCNGGCDEKVYDHDGPCPVCGMPLVDAATVAKPAHRRNLAILLFDGVQIIDYSAPWEVFGQTFVDGQPAFDIYTVAKNAAPVTTNMGQSVNPKYTIANAPKPDVLLVPGGAVYGTSQDPAVVSWIRKSADESEVVLSVCTGAFLLGKAGLLDGKTATTIAGSIDRLQSEFPAAHVVSDRRFADNGKIVVSAGLSSGMDSSLHVVEKLFGRGTAQAIATGLEYDWRPDGGYVRARLADRKLGHPWEALDGAKSRLVATEGDRNAWEVRWSVESGATPADLVAKIDAALAKREDARWSPDKSSRDGAEARWRLTFPSGETWLGTTEAKHDKAPGRILMSVRIARASVAAKR